MFYCSIKYLTWRPHVGTSDSINRANINTGKKAKTPVGCWSWILSLETLEGLRSARSAKNAWEPVHFSVADSQPSETIHLNSITRLWATEKTAEPTQSGGTLWRRWAFFYTRPPGNISESLCPYQSQPASVLPVRLWGGSVVSSPGATPFFYGNMPNHGGFGTGTATETNEKNS